MKINKSNSRASIDVLAERQRQIDVEGYTLEHDDRHRKGDLAQAAACYACNAATMIPRYNPLILNSSVTEQNYALKSSRSFRWPWRERWKPKNPRSDLVRAAALIIAEIERLDRSSEK